jgi:hypothetical protein
MFNNLFPESRTVYEIMWKNIVESDKPQCCACALHAGYQCYKHRVRMCNTYSCYGNNGYTNEPPVCLVLTFPALFQDTVRHCMTLVLISWCLLLWNLKFLRRWLCRLLFSEGVMAHGPSTPYPGYVTPCSIVLRGYVDKHHVQYRR